MDTSFRTGPAFSPNQYTGVSDIAMRQDPDHEPYSSSMSRNIADKTRPHGKEENLSMGKVMFLEAEVKRLRDALEKAIIDAARSNAATRGTGSVPLPSRDMGKDPVYLSQRPLQAQSQFSGNAGNLIDSSGSTMNPRNTTAFMRYGMSDVAFTPSPLAGPDVPLSSTEAFTPYGVIPQSLGFMNNPQAYAEHHLL
jgi:hypothetical protein